MKNMLTVLVVFGLGAVLGRLFDGPPPRAEAAGGNPPACQDINGDGKSDVTDAIFFLQWQFLAGPKPACSASDVPNTGQTKCYEYGREIPCDGASCPGQDGLYATGCPPEGRFVDHGDGTVTDTCTGLMWQKETADVNYDGQLSTDEDRIPWCEALFYCENLSFAGHDDWRLPNVRELQSIVDYGRFDPAIDPVFGALSSFIPGLGALPSLYWSSTSFADNPVSAWVVSFNDGGVLGKYRDKISNAYVRAVRRGT